MKRFSTPLDIRHIGVQSFLLLAPLVYENDTFTITVYEGFDYDGASIPKTLWSIVGCPVGELYSNAACIHDALYASKLFNRKTCDKIFHEAMLSSGVNKSLAKKMYLAVRAFGESAYTDSPDIQKYRNIVKIEVKNV